MAERNQVADRLVDTRFRVDYHVAHAVTAGLDVVEHNGNLLASQFVDQRRIDFRSHQQNAGNLAPYHAPYIVGGACAVVVSVRQNQIVAAFEGGDLDAFDEFRKERVRNVGHQETQRVAAAQGQAASVSVRVIAASLDCLHHPFASLLGNIPGVVDHV